MTGIKMWSSQRRRKSVFLAEDIYDSRGFQMKLLILCIGLAFSSVGILRFGRSFLTGQHKNEDEAAMMMAVGVIAIITFKIIS